MSQESPASRQISMRPSHRLTRILGTTWLAPKWRRSTLEILIIVLPVLAVTSWFLGDRRLAAWLLSLWLLDFMLVAWERWGMLEFAAQNPVADSDTNLSNLLSADIVKPLQKVNSAQALLQAIATHWQTSFVIRHLELPLEEMSPTIDQVSVDNIYTTAMMLATHAHQRHVTAGTLVAALALQVDARTHFLARHKLTPDDVLETLVWLEHLINDRMVRKQRDAYGGLGRDFSAGYTNFLDRFGTNMSDEVEAGHQVFSSLGREDIIEQLISLLNQSARPAVALVGPTGGGKTTLAYGFTERILTRAAGFLTYRKVIKLSANTLLSSVTDALPIERIVEEVIYDAVRAKNVVLFFDDAEAFFMSKPGAVDISQILLPVLQNTHLPMIFAFTAEDFGHFAQVRPNLFGQMTKLVVPPLSALATLRVLEDVALEYEVHNGLIISLAALRETVKLSERFTTTKQQPGAALDMLRASFTYATGGRVGAESVQAAVEAMTGVKTGTAGPAEAQQLLQLEDQIHQRMVNQTQAVSVVAAALRRARAGVKDSRRPIGSFLFMGPTGVGKTELARSLAATYFGGEDKMVRLDMSEYQQPSDVGRLLAAATETGTGSSFLEQIRLRPYSVVLLDEIEKAHPDILNLILQLLDEGRLTDTAGKAVSFRDAIIILTSNALADDIRSAVANGQDLGRLHDELLDKLITQQIFKPELLNRFDEVVIFRPLTPDELLQVVGIMEQSLNKTLEQQQITIELTESAKRYIVEIGNDPRMGARPMRRTLQRLVEDRISQGLLKGEILPGAKLMLDRRDIEHAQS